MADKEKIQHEGIVKSIKSDSIEVTIISHSACGSCHVKGNCGMAEVKQKTITVPCPQGKVKIGDKVMVYASLNNAFFSVLLAYVIPSILILVTIFILQWLGKNELTAATITLILLTLYFFILYLLRNKINKKIKFTIENISIY